MHSSVVAPRPGSARTRLRISTALGVQAVRGLVEHDDRRIAHERDGDPDPLAHAQREPPCVVVRPISEPDARPHIAHVGVTHRRAPSRRRGSSGSAARSMFLYSGGASMITPTFRAASRNPDVPGSWPRIRACPAVGRCSPRRTRIAVDFPAPLGPRSPTTVPAGTVNDRPSSTVRCPKRLTSPSNSIGEATWVMATNRHGRSGEDASLPGG